MSRTIMLIPTSTNSVGMNSIILGVICAMKRHGVHFKVFKPISKLCTSNHSLPPDQIKTISLKNSRIQTALPLTMNRVEFLWSNNQRDALMDEIVASYHENTKDKDTKLILVEGLMPTRKHRFTSELNYEIAKTLNAEIVFLISLKNDSPTKLTEQIKLTQSNFGGSKNKNITGIIINEMKGLFDEEGSTNPFFSDIFDDSTKVSRVVHIDNKQLLANIPLPVLGYIPWSFELIATRAIDICCYLDAKIINKGEIATRRVSSITFCTDNLKNILEYFLPNSLLVISADRPEVIIAACLAAMNQVKIGAILLTGGYVIDVPIQKLCERAFQTGLPIFMVNTNTWKTALNLQDFNNLELPRDDIQRIEYVQEYVASHINTDWIESLTIVSKRKLYFSPSTFRYQLTELARKAGKRIVLPEGNEPRTVKAANICAERGIADCVLLGNVREIQNIAAKLCIKLDNSVEIINPENVREKYVARLVELRKGKGMTEVVAKEQLEDNVMLGTMMLESGEVDGLVSGVIHTTANTVRPSLQVIKMAPNSSLVSSIFFMLLPEKVLVYGDCAINPHPNSEQLAEIAIQSADSAAMFGIEPRVAMISYSTGNSGTGRDVEKVREATCIAQKKRPDLVLDGPLQYDAAIMEDIAKLKAPNSPVAGRATVFIFPDLNTGNTTYKAVQRSADIMSIGPMLQGMRKPVNDLSRGALIDDIVYTIALTAIQSKQTES